MIFEFTETEQMSLFSARVIWFVFALLILFADGVYAKSTRFEVETKELIKRSDLIVAEKISKDSHGPVAASLTWLATKGRFPEDFGGIDPTLTFGPFFSLIPVPPEQMLYTHYLFIPLLTWATMLKLKR
jgi:hypothetical protein